MQNMAKASHCGYSDSVVLAVSDYVVECQRKQSEPLRVGISGLQGSGKSTLARQLKAVLEQRGLSTTCFSLDDFYLTHGERLRLAREVHPLLATRGVPGTHDHFWLAATLDQLSTANAERPVSIPRFDKGGDDRATPNQWQTVAGRPEVVLLEGWCVGVPGQLDAALLEPVNTLERDEDSDGVWRRWVNAMLCENYQPIWDSLDVLIVLQAPSFDVVKRWRGESEYERRGQGDDRAMSDQQLARFIAHYERLSTRSLATLPSVANRLLRLDSKRNVFAIESSSNDGWKYPS